MTTTMQGCTSRRTPDSPPCGSEPVIVARIGCVHEHLKEVATCQRHVKHLAHGRSTCIACWRVDGHVCEMAFLGEVTS